MKKILFFYMTLSYKAACQGINCEAYLYKGDTAQYNACKMIENIDNRYGQFSKEYHQVYDSAINISPNFAFGYREKSVAYLKSGDFITWKKLMDNSVKYDPKGNLGYMGWCRFQFFRDYKGAISDIESLEKIINYDIGVSQNGDYHLTVVKAMCYSAINQKRKGISIIELLLKSKNYSPMNYDFYQLGVMYFEINNFKMAKKCFALQAKLNDFADNEYYFAKTLKATKDYKKASLSLGLARRLFKDNKFLYDPYTHHFKNVYFN